jgi:hypothetical protein
MQGHLEISRRQKDELKEQLVTADAKDDPVLAPIA